MYVNSFGFSPPCPLSSYCEYLLLLSSSHSRGGRGKGDFFLLNTLDIHRHRTRFDGAQARSSVVPPCETERAGRSLQLSLFFLSLSSRFPREMTRISGIGGGRSINRTVLLLLSLSTTRVCEPQRNL